MKSLLTVKEASELSGWSAKTLYNYMSKRIIGYFRPNGGKVFIDRSELESLMRKNRVHSKDELSNQAVRHQQLKAS